MRELTEDEKRVRRDGLRILARLIARHHLAKTATLAATEHEEVDRPAAEQQTGAAS